MRVFCREHNRSFFAPRQNPIKCGNRDHTLGEIDFDGQAIPPSEIRWQYCCNCEHFCPVGGEAIDRCTACARQVSAIYLCDQCYTISFESNTPAKTKNFSLTSEGIPQPACPGCLRPASADMREHSCDEFGAELITAVNTCPFCNERLDIGPSFPASVAHYLKRTRSGNKVHVTFDYETEVFVPIDDGEFVLIRDTNDADQSIVIPRAPRITAMKQFYEFYEDYYYCANPAAGEVQIIEPVTVAPVAGGWQLKSRGVLEVLPDQPRKKPVNEKISPPAEESNKKPKAHPVIHESASARTCTGCGSLVEARYAFCWHCGEEMISAGETSVTSSREPAEESIDDGSAKVARPTASRLFSSEFAQKPEWPSREKVAGKKTIMLALVAPVVVSLGLFAAWRSLSSSPTAEPVMAQAKLDDSGPSNENTTAPAVPPAPQTSSSTPQDDELKKLRASRLAAGGVVRPDLVKAFNAAERQYPSDYRFSYERAKLTVKANRTRVYDQVFAALFRAAGKAIDSGKADEMLGNLETDKNGDFQSLTRERDEWRRLQRALKKRDKKILSDAA